MSVTIPASDPWFDLDNDLKNRLVRRVYKLLPDRSPADCWRGMRPTDRRDWEFRERFDEDPVNTWRHDNELIAACSDPATNVAFEQQEADHDPDGLFRRWTMTELLSEPDDFEWLIQGLYVSPTYGQIAGEMKTLKSYLATFIAVALACGMPLFGAFKPPGPRPVLMYIGEGGRKPWTRRLRRICDAMGVDPGDLDLHPTFDVADIASYRFQQSLRRDLAKLEPGLVLLDPFYAFHGLATRAADLHQEGSLLNMLSKPCLDAGSSLQVVNHFNQTGQGLSLRRITMAGSGEWADSWVLCEHRKGTAPDVHNGRFYLRLDIGSRQWGGSSWDLDLFIGRFDEESGTHDGPISWDIRRASEAGRAAGPTTTIAVAKERIQVALAEHGGGQTKTELKEAVRGGREVFNAAFEGLLASGEIVKTRGPHMEGGVKKERWLWVLATMSAD